MIKEICIIGHPSTLGGADTELLDQMHCWHKMGIKIYLLHTGVLSPNLTKMDLVNRYGCTYLSPRMWNQCKGMHCISFCNGEFLANLKFIKKHAKTTTFVNCMTWNFQNEIKAQSDGLIDFHLYQTDHAMERVSKNLRHLGTYRPLRVTPYFNSDNFKYYENRPNDHFRFGRISRGDAAKYSKDQLEIYEKFTSPVPKSCVILGWDYRAQAKFKNQKIPPFIQLLGECRTTQQEFYQFCDVLIMSTDTFENLPRVAFECMASGTVMVVDNRGGWTLQIDNGKSGFLCDGTPEFIEKSSFLANNPEQKELIRRASRDKLLREWGIEQSMKSWELIFKEWEKI